MAFAAVNNIETKIVKFLFAEQKRQMVTGEFITYRSVGRDADVIKLVSLLQEKTGREDGVFMIYYAQRKLYTVSLEFHWHPQTPAYYRNLETYWQMVQEGASEDACYDYYINNVHNVVGNEWQNALDESQKIWIPPEEGWNDEEGEDDGLGDEFDPTLAIDPISGKPKRKRKANDPN